MIKKTKTILVMCACALVVAAPVMSAKAQDTAKRIERVEKQLTALQRKVFGASGVTAEVAAKQPATANGSSSRKIMADMSVKISSIEKQMRRLTGRLEAIEYKQEQFEKKLDLLSKDTSIRFEEMRSTATTPATTNAPDSVAEPVKPPELSLPDGSQEVQYNWAYAYIRKNDLKNGQKALELFLKAHPKGDVSANAVFWLGRVHLLNANYARAAEQFLTVFEGYPQHKKAPESLLELGGAMIKLGENESACEAFLEFRRAYPDASARAMRRLVGDEKKAKC